MLNAIVLHVSGDSSIIYLQTGNLSSLIVPAATLGALGYGYMWWKVNLGLFRTEFEDKGFKENRVVFYVFRCVWWQVPKLNSSFRKKFKCVSYYIIINQICVP